MLRIAGRNGGTALHARHAAPFRAGRPARERPRPRCMAEPSAAAAPAPAVAEGLAVAPPPPPPPLPLVSPPSTPLPPDTLEFDRVVEEEMLRDNGPRSTRKTKLVCTIGPACCSYEQLAELAQAGMNVARLNMTHGTLDWHERVVGHIKRLNKERGYCIAIMVDTEGSEMHTGELREPIKTEEGTLVYFSVRNPPPESIDGHPVIACTFDALVDDLEVGDNIIVDGGMVELEVVAKAGPDVAARSIEQGLILSRANLTCRRNGELIRGRASLLPVISAKDWRDIDWAIAQGVDFLAISFVRTADVLQNLRSYISTRAPENGRTIELVAKLEAYDCLNNLDEIIQASDGIMVARGDLGAQIPVEEVPSVQKYAVMRARQLGKPSIVAHQLLQSMIEYPIPTRAEVADVADVVRQKADALMLSGESAMGAYPEKALGVLRAVSLRVEEWTASGSFGAPALPRIGETLDDRVSEEVCSAAASMANNLGAAAICVFTRRGFMAHRVSRCRPMCPIFAFTDDQGVRQRLNLRWGVNPFRVHLSQTNPEENIQRTFRLLKARGLLRSGDLVTVVSDLRPKEEDILRAVQLRRVA